MNDALNTLKNQLGTIVCTDPKKRFSASFDSAKLSFLPEAVIFPKCEDEIAATLRLANRYKIPVTTRGGGTATTGATSPIKGGWVVDLSSWKKIYIDDTSGYAYVQPGVKIANIHEEVEKCGWFYPPDPSSLRYASIGGAISTNAGGMRAAKYGVTRDYIYALEGFMPNGEWVRWGMDLKKFASGYNIRDLWIGSEGTLGIVTGAVLKLIPLPQSRWTCLAAFSDEKKALNAVQALLKERIVPSILEFLDQQSVTCVNKRLGKKNPFKELKTAALLLIEIDGTKEETVAQSHRIRTWAKTHAQQWKEAKSPQDAERLWEVRRQCSQAMFQMGNTKLNEDVVVPLDSQIPLLDFTQKIKQDTGLATPTFGHAADGNFHVHIMFNYDNARQRKKAEEAVKLLMDKVIELEGAITGEHGIGLTKSAFFDRQHSTAEIDIMKTIKKALDPNNILNPGKIFEPFPVWEHKPEKVRLPWE